MPGVGIIRSISPTKSGHLTPGRQPSPNPTNLRLPTRCQRRSIQDNGPGYIAGAFAGRENQMDKVMDILDTKGFIPLQYVERETNSFYNELGIDDMYFSTESVDVIASNIHSLYAAKIYAAAQDDKKVDLRLKKEAEDHALYIDTSKPGVTVLDGPHFERGIDEKYLNTSNVSQAFRVESFRSPGVLPNDDEQQIRLYFVYKCDFVNPSPKEDEVDLAVISDQKFLEKATKNTKEIYANIIAVAVNRSGPVLEVYDVEGTRDRRLVIAYKMGTAAGLYSSLSDLYHYYGLTSSRKYIEQFSNGITVMSIYLHEAQQVFAQGKFPPIEQSIHQIMKEASLLYCIPKNVFQTHFLKGRLSLQQTIYAHCCWVYIGHFIQRLGTEYNTLTSVLDAKNSTHMELLNKIKRRLRNETFTADYLFEIINQYPGLIQALYLSFASYHYVSVREEDDSFAPTGSKVLSDEELEELINKTVVNEHHEMVMTAFRMFNNSVLKTNFYTPTKQAVSFRLDSSFLPAEEYPDPLFGMFLVIGSEFRGFHLRFKDVSRGGIRIVKSRSQEGYIMNARSLFDENYNLANTQNRKNKDIPEGGAKGVVLLDANAQDKARVAFEKYIDSLLDLLLPASSPGIKDPVVDLHGKEEVLFCGPDEGTADMVDWATEHARKRNAPFWKSFFTGKSPRLGGIPHDRYGMTTLSVREYVQGIYRKLGLNEKEVRKLQTGGPDGDLGSNEILLGKEKYTAIVDGSGVLYDPNGLERDELLKLAKARSMISNFDISKLGKDGYRVLVDDMDIKLPTGEVIHNGTQFRNTFHLRPGAYDVFVPCGGRPESVDLSTVGRLIEDKKSTIPYFVEGANLFFTSDARLRLEQAGAVVFKDASANKGGVTSSSLEVLASLAFDDAGFVKHMCVDQEGKLPEFYQSYVKEVQEVIKRNARFEFEAIWRENEETGKPRSVLSDKISVAIVTLDNQLQHSDLWNDLQLRQSILKDALPKTLIDKIGFEMIVERVPDSYLRAIFGSYLASRFVYEHGSSPGQFAFFDFMKKRMATLSLAATTF